MSDIKRKIDELEAMARKVKIEEAKRELEDLFGGVLFHIFNWLWFVVVGCAVVLAAYPVMLFARWVFGL